MKKDDSHSRASPIWPSERVHLLIKQTQQLTPTDHNLVSSIYRYYSHLSFIIVVSFLRLDTFQDGDPFKQKSEDGLASAPVGTGQCGL